MSKIVIFVHIPKTGGGTFRRYLDSVYPKHNRDTGDQFDIKTILTDCKKYPYKVGYKKLDFISGHFVYERYKHMTDARFVTFVRNPVERVISTYYYNMKYFGAPIKGTTIQKKLMADHPTMKLVDYAETCPNIMSQFIGDPKNFEFIGILEQFDKSINRFCKQFKVKKNNNTLKKINKLVNKPKVEAKVRKKIEDINKIDLELYNQIIGEQRK